MKAKLLSLCLLGAITLSFTACETENSTNADTNNSKQTIEVNSTNVNLPDVSPCLTTNLLAGQRYDVGDISVYFDEEKVYVEYQASANWFIRKTQLYIGDCELIPVNRRGVPIPGHYPFGATAPNGTQNVVYAMDKADLPKCFCISAHAEVYRIHNFQIVQAETAWAQGERFNENSWGMFFSICSDDCSN